MARNDEQKIGPIPTLADEIQAATGDNNFLLNLVENLYGAGIVKMGTKGLAKILADYGSKNVVKGILKSNTRSVANINLMKKTTEKSIDQLIKNNDFKQAILKANPGMVEKGGHLVRVPHTFPRVEKVTRQAPKGFMKSLIRKIWPAAFLGVGGDEPKKP